MQGLKLSPQGCMELNTEDVMKLTESQKEALLELAKRTVRKGMSPQFDSITITPPLAKALEKKGLVIASYRQWGSKGKRERIANCIITNKGLDAAIKAKVGGPILSL